MRIVDLFSGCGGMTLGAIEAARRIGRPAEVVLAMELDEKVRARFEELGAESLPVIGKLLNTGALHPTAAGVQPGMKQMFGDVWEWTASPYAAYPGYQPLPGALGEYNGKFMCNQVVLRGGSCATPADHIRATYRNFFYADARWQFMGVRLARNL